MYPAHVPISPLDTPIIPNTLSDIRALSSLNLASNKVGEMVPPAGWTKRRVESQEEYDVYGNEVCVHADGTKQKQDPPGSKPEGVIAVTNAIKHMGALTSLHVGKNSIPEKEAREIMAIAVHLDSMKILCEVPFKDKTLTALDISGKDLGMEGALVVAEYLDGNGVLTKFDISKCDLMAEGGKALAAGLKGNQVITELNISSNDLGWNSDCKADTSGIIAIADAIPDMRALTLLNMSANGLKGAEAGKALGDAIAANPVLKDLDISGGEYYPQKCDVAFVQTFSVGLRDNRALSIANVMGNHIGKEMLSKLQEIMRSKPNLVSLCGIADDATEADLSGLDMDADDAIILASELPDKRAISSLDLLENDIPMEHAKSLANILKEHPTLKSLCGNSGEEIELDMSGKKIGVKGAIMLAPEITGNGALMSLNLASNCLCGIDENGDGVRVSGGTSAMATGVSNTGFL
jgi:hypothetical protein